MIANEIYQLALSIILFGLVGSIAYLFYKPSWLKLAIKIFKFMAWLSGQITLELGLGFTAFIILILLGVI